MKHHSTETKVTTRFSLRTIAVGFSVSVLIVAAGLFWWAVPFYKLAHQWESAQAAKNISAMEELYCWDGVDAETRQRMHLLLLQEFEHPVKSVKVVRWHDDGELSRLSPNLKPVAQLKVVFDNPEHFQVSFMIGRTVEGACKLAVMVPKP